MSEEAELTTLEEVTYELGLAYKSWKTGETRKNKYKDQFFKLAADAESTLAEQIITVRAKDEEEARELAGRLYPKWDVEDLRIDPSDQEGDDLWEVIIRENPEFKPHSYVNPKDGMVYQRSIQSGSIMLDDELLQERDPELWLEVTEIPNRTFMENLLYHCNVDNTEIDETLDNLWEVLDGPRDLIPFEDLSPDTLARLGEYIYEGKPTIKLPAPRKAKEEDLANSSEV